MAEDIQNLSRPVIEEGCRAFYNRLYHLNAEEDEVLV